MAEPKGWMRHVWRMADDALRAASDGARKVVRILRILRAFMLLAVLTVLASGVVGVVRPSWFPWFYLASSLFLVIPLVILLLLVWLPLRAKSIVRLIDLGYPRNTRELAIRVVARKLHEESIESEDLLLKTAWNESRKLVKKYRARAERLKKELDAEPMPGEGDAPRGPGPSG